MAVETDFAATLLSNLKLEDPWLPPSSWESIPSESGRRFPRPLSSSDHRPNHQVSSVSEASMVRLAMNALQGAQSALISIEKISTAFFSYPADRTFHRIPSLWNRCSSTHAQGKILKSIGRSGFLVFLLCRFVDYFRNSNLDDKILGIRDHHDGKVQQEEYPPYSLVNHAFSVAVGKVIEGYICALDTLYASVHLRRSSDSVELPLEVCSSVGCLTTVFHSETTLLELYSHTKELRTQIEALGNICNLCTVVLSYTESSFEDLIAKSMIEFRSFFRGGELLTYLYTQLQVVDPPHHELLKFIFLRSCEPYCGFIRSWIYKAEISDPYKEFVVEHSECSPFHGHGKADTSSDFSIASSRVRDGVALPCFLKDYLIPLVRSGQQLQVLMKLLEFCTYVTAEDLTFEDLLPNWNGSFGDNSTIAFPITFEKNEIEARALERGSYYGRMQEKLESLLTKFEFRYQQVISHDTTPNGFGNGWRSSSSPISFKLMALTVEDKGDGDDTHSEDSYMVDGIPYASSNHESSECSLSINSEEGTLADQLIDLSSHMVGIERKYLSALSFSTGPLYSTLQEKPYECEELHNDGIDPDGICEGREALCHYQQSQFNEMLLDKIITPIESEDPNWPVSGRYKSSINANGCYGDKLRSNLLDCHPKVCKLGALKEGLSYYRKMIVTDDTLPEELFSKDQHGNMTHESDLFRLKDWQVTSDNNFLSLNPMLTKNTFLELRTDHRERDGIRAQSLPYFDFSSVEDPCKARLDKVSVGFMDSSASTPGIKSDPVDKDKHGQYTLIHKTKTRNFTSLPEPKAHNHGDGVPPHVSGGSSWESSLARTSNTIVNSAGDRRDSSLAKFDIPLDFIIDKCLQQEIMLQYKYISKLTIKLLEEGFDFKEHLLALRRYHFMELADWADLFIISLSNHKWCITEAEQRLAEIQGFLEISIQRSSCEFDHNKDRLYVYMQGNDTLPLTTSAIGLHSFDFLGLGYRVDWPVSIVLTAGALKIYSEIFSFLIKVRLANFSLTDVWCSFKELRPLISQNQHVEQREKEVHHFNLLMKMRCQNKPTSVSASFTEFLRIRSRIFHAVNHFVTTLQQYVESQLSHVLWCRFLHSLQHKVKDMMDLESVHMAYLIDSLDICFLSDETQHVARIIDGILQCALDFRFALRGGILDVGINQGDVAARLSRINISKLLSIKKTFDKNLKELHLHYLRSPKHSNYGLARFWGYLNYNEYYSDIVNEGRNYAFSL